MSLLQLTLIAAYGADKAAQVSICSPLEIATGKDLFCDVMDNYATHNDPRSLR